MFAFVPLSPYHADDMLINISYAEPCCFLSCEASMQYSLTSEISCDKPIDKLLLFYGHYMELLSTFLNVACFKYIWLCNTNNFYISCAAIFRDNVVNIGGEKPVKKLKVI